MTAKHITGTPHLQLQTVLMRVTGPPSAAGSAGGGPVLGSVAVSVSQGQLQGHRHARASARVSARVSVTAKHISHTVHQDKTAQDGAFAFEVLHPQPYLWNPRACRASGLPACVGRGCVA